MTDARLPDRWLSDRRFQRLSDAHFRSYVNGLLWAVSNRTDGVILPDDLGLIPQFDKSAIRSFLAANLWSTREGADRGWIFTDYLATQTTAAQMKSLETARAKEREKKARQRAAKRAASTAAPALVVPRDVTRDNTGQDRQGEDRQGKGEVLPMGAGAEDWPNWRGAGPSPFEEYN